RVLRPILLIVVGAVALASPLELLRGLIMLVRGLLVLWGISELVRRLNFAISGAASRYAPRRRDLVPWGLTALAVAILLAAGLPRIIGGDEPRRAPVARAFRSNECNGHVELCGRRLDQVAFPATHNAMSAASAGGWMVPSQDGSMRDQLDFGVRGFL